MPATAHGAHRRKVPGTIDGHSPWGRPRPSKAALRRSVKLHGSFTPALDPWALMTAPVAQMRHKGQRLVARLLSLVERRALGRPRLHLHGVDAAVQHTRCLPLERFDQLEIHACVRACTWVRARRAGHGVFARWRPDAYERVDSEAVRSRGAHDSKGLRARAPCMGARIRCRR